MVQSEKLGPSLGVDGDEAMSMALQKRMLCHEQTRSIGASMQIALRSTGTSRVPQVVRKFVTQLRMNKVSLVVSLRNLTRT